MKKAVSLILSTAMIIPFAAGFGTTATVSATAKPNVTLSFGSHQSGLPSSGIVQKIAKEYEKKTGVHIDFQISPDAQWKDMIKTKLATGEAPDIFCEDSGTSLESEYHVTKNCVDLSHQSWVGRIDKTALEMVSSGGKVYGITFPGFKVWWYYYNKNIFSKLNLKVPKTYAQFKAVCSKIKASGVTPIYEACQDGWHQQLPIYELGGFYATKNIDMYKKLNTHKMTLPQIKQLKTVVTQMKEFQTLGYFGTDYNSNSVANDEKAFADGKVAMTLEGLGWEQQTAKDFPKTSGNVGFFVQPWADNQTLGVNPASNAYFINKKSAHVKEAEAFFKYLAQPSVLQERLNGDPSSLALCWTGVKAKYPDSYTKYMNSLKKGTVMQVAFSYSGSEWMDVGKDVSALYAGAVTPDQLIQGMQSRVDSLAKLQKDPNWK